MTSMTCIYEWDELSTKQGRRGLMRDGVQRTSRLWLLLLLLGYRVQSHKFLPLPIRENQGLGLCATSSRRSQSRLLPYYQTIYCCLCAQLVAFPSVCVFFLILFLHSQPRADIHFHIVRSSDYHVADLENRECLYTTQPRCRSLRRLQ